MCPKLNFLYFSPKSDLRTAFLTLVNGKSILLAPLLFPVGRVKKWAIGKAKMWFEEPWPHHREAKYKKDEFGVERQWLNNWHTHLKSKSDHALIFAENSTRALHFARVRVSPHCD